MRLVCILCGVNFAGMEALAGSSRYRALAPYLQAEQVKSFGEIVTAVS